jgi:hypothetical protein
MTFEGRHDAGLLRCLSQRALSIAHGFLRAVGTHPMATPSAHFSGKTLKKLVAPRLCEFFING